MSDFRKSKHIVVAGAGYAGLPALLTLARGIGKHHEEIRLTCVNPDPKQELVCELHRTLRTGSPELFAFRDLFRNKNIEYVDGRVDELKLESGTLSVRGEHRVEIPYDYLVLATGSKLELPPVQGLQEAIDARDTIHPRIFPFRSNTDALNLRVALRRLGWSPEARPEPFKDLFVVVMGAGSTGLEVAGEIAALRGRNSRLRVVLLDSASELLPDFSPIARRLMKRELSQLKIETILGSPATKLTSNEIHTELGHVIPWDLLVLCTGSRVPRRMLEVFGPSLSPQGLDVNGDLQIKGYPGHYAVGDIAHLPQVPKRAQFASQQGVYVAQQILNRCLPKEDHAPTGLPDYEMNDWGYLVSMGPRHGIGRLGASSAESHIPKILSPFLIGSAVDKAKLAAKMRYLLLLKTGL